MDEQQRKVVEWEREANRRAKIIRGHVNNMIKAKNRGDEAEVERLRMVVRSETQRLTQHARSMPKGAKFPEIPKE